jgi:acyl-CoA synthetase (AMP-forming)/AMP-acid ligase II
LAIALSTSLANEYGITAGTNIAIMASNSIYYPVVMLACSRLGGVVTCSSPEYGVEEASYIIEASSSRELIFVDSTSHKTMIAVASRLGISRNRLVSIDFDPALVHLRDLIWKGRNAMSPVPFWTLPRGLVNTETLAYLSFTSGTTSRPKAVSGTWEL